MALTVNAPLLRQQTIYAHSESLGGTGTVAYTRVPFRGTIVKMGVVNYGVLTNADANVLVKVGGITANTTVLGGGITITVSGLAAGTVSTNVPTGGNTVNEDDVISFATTGASGASMPGTFFAVIRAG